MALDKLVDSTRLDGALTATANAILSKTGGSSPLTWDMDDGFSDDIAAISTGGVIVSDTTDSHGGTIRTINSTQTPVMLQAKTGINPTSSSQTITPDTGYDGLSSVQINAASGGGTAVSDTTAVAVDVLSGKYFHIADGTKVQGTIVSKTSSDVTTSSNVVTIPAGHYASQVQKTVGTAQAAQTITPTTSDQTIASDKYLTGTQTIKGDANLVAGNIKKDVSIFGVTGSYEGGGGGSPTLIQFKFQKTSTTYFHVAEQGMTFAEWVQSDYCPHSSYYGTSEGYYTVSTNCIASYPGGYTLKATASSSAPDIPPSTVITSGTAYYLIIGK